MASMRLVADVFTLGWGGTLARLAVATALGAAIGLERELDEKSAGLRTHMLVSLGSALFTLVSAYGFSEFIGKDHVSFDPSRIAAQIVTGIGFLGAGVIFRSGFNVRGLTTAASLWLVAAIGMASGAGYWQGAVIATGAGIVALRPLEWLKRGALRAQRISQMTVVLAEGASGARVMEAVERTADVLAVRRDGRRLDVETKLGPDNRAQLLNDVAGLEEVEEARWER
jgi:putative Mg2+ transporter-C (MgtC) family protein